MLTPGCRAFGEALGILNAGSREQGFVIRIIGGMRPVSFSNFSKTPGIGAEGAHKGALSKCIRNKLGKGRIFGVYSEMSRFYKIKSSGDTPKGCGLPETCG